MKMSEVKVGMILRPKSPADGHRIRVSEITERGFKYNLVGGPQPFIPRWGVSFAETGHEHFGMDGEALYELAGSLTHVQTDTWGGATANPGV